MNVTKIPFVSYVTYQWGHQAFFSLIQAFMLAVSWGLTLREEVGDRIAHHTIVHLTLSLREGSVIRRGNSPTKCKFRFWNSKEGSFKVQNLLKGRSLKMQKIVGVSHQIQRHTMASCWLQKLLIWVIFGRETHVEVCLVRESSQIGLILDPQYQRESVKVQRVQRSILGLFLLLLLLFVSCWS